MVLGRGDSQRWRDRPIRTGRRDRPIVQPPTIALRVLIMAGITLALVAMILFRLWFLQILAGKQYVAEANDNRLRTVKVVAPRGVIMDRTGTVIVDNRPGLAIGIRVMDLPSGGDKQKRLVKRLAAVIGMTPQQVYTELRKHPGYRYDLRIVKRDVSQSEVNYILEHKFSFPGVEVQKDYLRSYPFTTLAAHVLGYVGPISADQLKTPRFRGYALDAEIGQAGVEWTYDSFLRGIDGSYKIQVDVNGNPKKGASVSGGTQPQAGDNLVLTIDRRIQRAAQRAVVQGIRIAHQNANWGANGGGAVVMNVRNGEILAMASYPTYDPSVYVSGLSEKDYKALSQPSANFPLLSRVDQTPYAVGSTFKPITAIAGLEEGVITPYTTFYCPGSYTPPHLLHKQVFPCWLKSGHGSMSLLYALEESCDVYFYNVGDLFFYRKGTELEDWATRLGLGKSTGIDIPGEVVGLMPTPQWKKKHFAGPHFNAVDRNWPPGDSIHLAVGQGYVTATPLQMAVAYAAIANGGYVVTPHLGLKLLNPSGTLARTLKPPRRRKLDILPGVLSWIRRGLVLAANGGNGTSTPVFAGYPVTVAGKTGTAEVVVGGRLLNYAWYISYAPADNPKYVVAVMIEKGGHGGTAAAPAARMIYDALFNVRSGVAHGTLRSD
jgi:penicillin-binding protein 2